MIFFSDCEHFLIFFSYSLMDFAHGCCQLKCFLPKLFCFPLETSWSGKLLVSYSFTVIMTCWLAFFFNYHIKYWGNILQTLYWLWVRLQYVIWNKSNTVIIATLFDFCLFDLNPTVERICFCTIDKIKCRLQ